jgi:sortase A
MRIVVLKTPLRRFLRGINIALFAAGVTLLLYCAFVLADGWAFQRRERRQLEQLVADRKDAVREAPLRASQPRPATAQGGLIGRIEIPRLGLSAMVMEGTSKKNLRHAVGHITGTALPGDQGNLGISGHRDTFFRPLRNIRLDDVITLTTPLGEYRYRVISTKVVPPSDTTVLDSIGNEILTLVTCYPFYFVGPAPGRFVVWAERVA